MYTYYRNVSEICTCIVLAIYIHMQLVIFMWLLINSAPAIFGNSNCVSVTTQTNIICVFLFVRDHFLDHVCQCGNIILHNIQHKYIIALSDNYWSTTIIIIVNNTSCRSKS